jgi:hypothetical protein
MLFLTPIIFFIRGEFVFFPLLYVLLLLFILIIKSKRNRLFFFLTVTLGGMIIYFNGILANIIDIFEITNKIYLESAINNGIGLGVSVVMGAPFVFKIFSGPFYLLFFPIPFWIGFIKGYSYDFFMSINAIYSLYILPFILISFYAFIRGKTVDFFFSFFIFSSYLISIYIIVFTTLQNRHLLAFIPLQLIIVNLINDSVLKNVEFSFKFNTYLFFLIIQTVWLILKIVQ